MKAKIGKYLKSKKPKVNIEIEEFDTYSLDHTLALIILPALIDLKNTKQGIPIDFADVGGDQGESQTCFDFYYDTHPEAFERGIANWEETLDKMIWSFQQLVEDNYSEKYHHGKMQWDWIKTDETEYNPITGKTEPFYEMVDLNPGEHWYDDVGHNLHEERIQEGLELFGKYYRALWS